ncbi:hypothetical protein HIM_09918 [Hirsutella minnesotensis 3608]|uniref:Uncharacterized protein n=1 Tax=Hirsutella minnesotensis 3608 TaxID=1043627 RepID=A0A0F8A2U1_9HYPO|nr:hypothetical protein HIM_09918 [Hirsutella minnesotensis 3608]
METVKPVKENLQDGGINAYTTLLGGFCACFSTLGFLNTVGDWHEFYASGLHGPISDVSASCIVLTQVMVALGAAAPVRAPTHFETVFL